MLYLCFSGSWVHVAVEMNLFGILKYFKSLFVSECDLRSENLFLLAGRVVYAF